MNTFDTLWGIIRAQFFYDFKSSLSSIFLIIGFTFFYALLKDNYEKLGKTLARIAGAVVFCFIGMALY